MKCYEHPKVNAVGVCSECGKGICSKCSVEISGKLYCKPCTDKKFGAQKKEAPETKAIIEAPKAAAQTSNVALRNSVLGQSSFAWMLGILGLFILPPLCWGLGLIFGYMAVSKASDNLDVFSQRDVIVCGIGAIANLALLVYWGIGMVNLLP